MPQPQVYLLHMFVPSRHLAAFQTVVEENGYRCEVVNGKPDERGQYLMRVPLPFQEELVTAKNESGLSAG